MIQVCVYVFGQSVCVGQVYGGPSVWGGPSVGGQVCGGPSVCVGQVCVWAKCVCGPSEIRISQNLGLPHIFLISEVNSQPILTIFFLNRSLGPQLQESEVIFPFWGL